MKTSPRPRRPRPAAALGLIVGSACLLSYDRSAALPPDPRTPAQAPAPSPPGMPNPDAKELWDYIQSPKTGYRTWKTFPGSAGPLKASELPHGNWVTVRVNDTGFAALEKQVKDKAPGFSMPAGSILVKENYPASAAPPCASDLLLLTVMYKPPALFNGGKDRFGDTGWYWAMYSPTGYVQVINMQGFMLHTDQFNKYRGQISAGSPTVCTDCHSGANAQGDARGLGDYIWNLAPFETK